MTSEEREGPTPNGGVRSVAHYLDAAGRPAEKGQAVKVRILEFDAGGDIVMTTHGEIGAKPPGGDT